MASTLLLQSTMGFLRPSTALPAVRAAAAAGLRSSHSRRFLAMISTETKGATETEEFRVFFKVRLMFVCRDGGGCRAGAVAWVWARRRVSITASTHPMSISLVNAGI